MSVASRPVSPGKTRTCPHCKATILESLSICPGCLHHLRFDQEAAKRQVAATSALRVEGVIRHPPLEEPWEYFVVISIRNDRGEEVTRQVVNVGALHSTDKRTFTLSVDMMPLQAPATTNGPQVPVAGANGPKPPAMTASAPRAGAGQPAKGQPPNPPSSASGPASPKR
jgi:hypothetical protein